MNTLTQYRPNQVSLFRDFDTMLNRFFHDDFFSQTKCPSVDIREDEDKFVLEAELAGLTEKDIDINVENHMLTLSSSKEEKKEEEKKGYVLKERKNASFSRSFMLPENVDVDKINAEMKNGILTVDIPKSEAAKPKKISVKSK